MNSKILWITHRSSIDNYAYPRCPFEVSMTPMRVDDFRPGSFLITALSTVRGRAARKVVKGGKKMTFRAIVIIGDTKRKVGVGIGRAEDVNLAIEKAVLNGKKNLITVPLTVFFSVPHVIKASYGACKIMLRPASQGTGVIAGGSVRTVLELAGVQNILAKQFGSSNILNNAKATILALTRCNEKIELGKAQSLRKQQFYEKIMRKFKHN